MIVKVIDYFLTLGIRKGKINANNIFDELSGTATSQKDNISWYEKNYISQIEPFYLFAKKKIYENI